MKPVVAALAACGLVLTVLPVVALDAANAAAEEAAAQDAPMSREQRIQVQQGLASLGFDPGPADGLFGPKTRAAIWDWQNAKGLEATGFLTREEAEALGAMGQAAEVYNEELDAETAGPDQPEPEEVAPQSFGSQNLVLYFPQCSDLDELPPDETGCWQAVSNRQDCYFFLPRMDFSYRKEQFTWSGVCQHNAAHGRGTMKYDFETGEGTVGTASGSGALIEGRRQGNWVLHARAINGTEVTLEGPYVDGVENGHWASLSRYSDGDELAEEGPYADGAKHGHWVKRYRHSDGNGLTEEGPYVNGAKHGHWVKRYRHSDGNELTVEGPYVDGTAQGRWVERHRYPDGTEKTDEGFYVDGKGHGRWVRRYSYPDGTENTVHLECHHGECEEQ